MMTADSLGRRCLQGQFAIALVGLLSRKGRSTWVEPSSRGLDCCRYTWLWLWLLGSASSSSNRFHCSWILRWLHRADATMMLAPALVTLVGGTATATHMPLPQTCVATSSLLQDSPAFIHTCDTLTAVR